MKRYSIHPYCPGATVHGAHTGTIYDPSIPLSEFDIINIQHMAVTPGKQYLAVTTMGYGQALMHMVVKTLPRTYSCARLSTQKNYDPTIIDLHQYIVDSQQENHCLETTVPYIDFLWIEATEDLISKPWYAQVERTVCGYVAGAVLVIQE